jgi:hypothetical protein
MADPQRLYVGEVLVIEATGKVLSVVMRDNCISFR